MNELVESGYGVNIAGMPMGLAIMFNDKLYERCKALAGVMSKAEGITPPHLIGKPEACYAVVTRSITWRLDPFAVANATFATPGGRVGYEGKLVAAILENSGRLQGGVNFERLGDWSAVNGKFEIKESQKGNKYPVPTWDRKDAKGLGVRVSAQVKGEADPRFLDVWLDEMFPLNSTLWATRPYQQICYTGTRAFANTIAPGILFGVPFEGDAEPMRDVTPRRPVRDDFPEPEAATVNPETGEIIDDADEKIAEYSPADAFRRGHDEAAEGRSIKAVPPEWRDDPKYEPLAAAWIEGHKDFHSAGGKLL